MLSAVSYTQWARDAGLPVLTRAARSTAQALEAREVGREGSICRPRASLFCPAFSYCREAGECPRLHGMGRRLEEVQQWEDTHLLGKVVRMPVCRPPHPTSFCVSPTPEL